MATNHYFKNFNSFPQQELLNDLTREVIQMSGLDVYYLIKTESTAKDKIFNEDATATFTSAKQVEMYISSPEGYGGAGDTVTRFGLDIQDEIILTVNKERFTQEANLAAPREGDLIYVPLGKQLFEVRFVEHEKPFYSLGKNTVHELTCETFRYSNEVFDIPDIENGAIFNKIERENAVSREFTISSIDSYIIGEEIYQGPAGLPTATAKVASQSGNTLNVYRVGGEFNLNTTIVGKKSEVSTVLISVDDKVQIQSEFDDNKIFETDGDNILDFSELDPWSEGGV